jgi:predicted DCC family thiol-disulfide oxidoreductase YuxK
MTQPIVVFDGECALCNGFVAWLLRHDKRGVFRIAGSAGEVGRAVVSSAGLEGEVVQSTIVVWEGTRGLVRSDAVIEIARQLGWPWRALRVGRALPRTWRDSMYGAIARRRSRLEAEDPSCGVPPSELVALWRSRLATMADVPHNAKTSP